MTSTLKPLYPADKKSTTSVMATQNLNPNGDTGRNDTDALFKVFDRTLMQTLEKFSFRMKSACDKLSAKLDRCENKVKTYVKTLVTKTTTDLDRKYYMHLNYFL